MCVAVVLRIHKITLTCHPYWRHTLIPPLPRMCVFFFHDEGNTARRVLSPSLYMPDCEMCILECPRCLWSVAHRYTPSEYIRRGNAIWVGHIVSLAIDRVRKRVCGCGCCLVEYVLAEIEFDSFSIVAMPSWRRIPRGDALGRPHGQFPVVVSWTRTKSCYMYGFIQRDAHIHLGWSL